MTLNEDGSASGAENTQTDTTANTVSDANSASSSNAGENEGAKPSLLSAVKDVLTKEQVGESPNAKTENKDASLSDPNAQQEGANKDDANLSQEEKDKKLPFHEHPRFKEVIAEKNQLKQEVEAHKADASEWRAVKSFMSQQNLADAEVAEGFRIMAAMKNDPAQAVEMLKPYWSRLSQFIGEVLPNDLQQKVADGFIDEQSAREMARMRSQSEFQQARSAEQLQRAEAERQRQIQEQQQQLEVQRSEVVRQAVTGWEASVKARDLDYAQKEPLVRAKVAEKLLAGRPQTAQEAVQVVQAAYDEVSDFLRKVASPQRRAVNPVSSSNSSVATKSVPKSFREAVMLAARGET